MECPKCHEPLEVGAYVPEEQRLSLSIEYESEMVAARTFGETISNTAKLLQSVAREMGQPVFVVIEGIDYAPRKAAVHFVILAKKPSPRQGEKCLAETADGQELARCKEYPRCI